MNLNRYLVATILIFSVFFPTGNRPLIACDETLVMLLTSQNPASEFSKTIRSFTTALSALGTSLKNGQKDNYDTEMAQVMNAWLEFSKRYMTNPPEEARNDRNWAQKTGETARFIGQIRKNVSGNNFKAAHDQVLDLSSRIGAFFEAFGVSDEKQLFIKTSTNLTNLERYLLNNEITAAQTLVAELKSNLDEFAPMLPDSYSGNIASTGALLSALETHIAENRSKAGTDIVVQDLKAAFEALRSFILMHEWFPALDKTSQEQ